MPLKIGIDSYVTIEEANEYISGKLFAEEWGQADTNTRGNALKEACRQINRIKYKGQKADPAQILAFPRTMPIFNRLGRIGFAIYETVPENVKAAQCEIALALLKHGNTSRMKLQEQNVISVKIGDTTETYGSKKAGKLISEEAYELLKEYIAGAVVIR